MFCSNWKVVTFSTKPQYICKTSFRLWLLKFWLISELGIMFHVYIFMSHNSKFSQDKDLWDSCHTRFYKTSFPIFERNCSLYAVRQHWRSSNAPAFFPASPSERPPYCSFKQYIYSILPQEGSFVTGVSGCVIRVYLRNKKTVVTASTLSRTIRIFCQSAF